MMHYQNERNYGCRVSDSWTYRGLKTVVLENDLLRIVILADKGADIYQFIYKPLDVDFLWRSPWGVRDTSRFIPTTGDGVGNWMDTYEGGWQTVFPGGGFPSKYGEADLGLHAEANTMPWDVVILEDNVDKVSVKFSVRTYRTPFYFEKTLTLVRDTAVLYVNQNLVNEGEEPIHCVWGEHIALGAPFLDESCVIHVPEGKIFNHPVSMHENSKLQPGLKTEWPLTKLHDGTSHDLSKIPGKEFRSYDQSYLEGFDEGWYAITNSNIGVGFGVSYPSDLYKYLWYWQSLGGGFGYPWYGRTYNIGLEPFTSITNEGLQTAIDNGTALLLDAGQKIESSIAAVAYTSEKPVSNIDKKGILKFD